MIVRVLGEGQFQLPGAYLDQLNAIDNQIVEAVSHEDDAEFQRLLAEMVTLVKTRGTPLPDEELHESDLIVPAPDSSLEEVEHLFSGEGIVPG